VLRLTAYTRRPRASPFDALLEVPLRMTKVISAISMALDGYVTAPNACAEAPLGAIPFT
jgi:hypothetical protein